MNNLTLMEWSAIAQILIAILTVVGVIVSLYMSTRALKENKEDRLIRQKPHLAFEGSGWELPIEFVSAGGCIPGIDPECANEIFSNLPKDAESIRLRHEENKKFPFYGELKNFGLGPALETEVSWISSSIKIGSETFIINASKRKEPLYSRPLNTMPSWPQHILPGGNAKLTRLPTFIDKDYEKKISEVEGILMIKYLDVFGNSHNTNQKFWIETNYKAEKPTVHVTFMDVIIKKG